MTEPAQPTPPEPPPPPTPAARGPRTLPKTTLALAGVLVLALGFVGGVGVSRATAAGDEPPSVAGQGGGPRGGVYQSQGPGNAVVGTVTRVDGDTVYVKTPDGKTVEVSTDDETDIRVSRQGTVDDLDKGSNVVVRGEKDGDSVTASNIDAGGNRPTRIGP